MRPALRDWPYISASPSHIFRGNIPNKAITDDDIGDTTKKMLPFNIPDEIEMTLLQHEKGFFGDIVALGIFFANRQ